FISAQFLLDRLHHAPAAIDIFGTVLAVRRYRGNMVKSLDEYEFLYAFVRYVIEKEQLARP
ncbi:protein-tyrosine phosphatase family protein, partial [Pseudomonas syringae pv. actinidiae]|nr:protein-tyrosine phosphatase family protein [Pseudomonas syringae pv. actinidiae]